MKCPRCDNEWDTGKTSACLYCGYAVRNPQQPQQSIPPGRTSNPLLRRVNPTYPAAPGPQANRTMPFPSAGTSRQLDAGNYAAMPPMGETRNGTPPSFFPDVNPAQPSFLPNANLASSSFGSPPAANNSGAPVNRVGNPNYRPPVMPAVTGSFPALPMSSDEDIDPIQQNLMRSPDPRNRSDASGFSSMSNPVMRAVPQSRPQNLNQRGNASASPYLNTQAPPLNTQAPPLNTQAPPVSPFPSSAYSPPASPLPRSAQPGGFAERKPFFTTNNPYTPTPAIPGRDNQPGQPKQGTGSIPRQGTGGQARIDLDAWTARNRPPRSQSAGADTLNRPNFNLPPGQSGALPRSFGQRPQENQQRTGGFQRSAGTLPPRSQTSASLPRLLTPGAMLRDGRYRLHEKQGQQDWLNGVYEAHWLGHDAQHPNSRVLICEVVLPDVTPVVQQSLLRTATMALSSVGRHPHIAALWDAFNEQGRTFFVFEHVEGESLRTRVQRLGRPLAEQEVVECCLQMAEVLELLSQQSPPLVHGMISPDMISVNAASNHYILTNFSIILAGGATQFISGIDRSKLSAYTPPEFSRGLIDGRSDLYSLLATIYYVVTGSVPSRSNGNNTISPARTLNPLLSPELEVILTRGLRPVAVQRYQRPSELRQDLLSIRSVSSTLTVLSEPGLTDGSMLSSAVAPSNALATNGIPEHIAQALPILRSETVSSDEEDYSPLLPRPEEMAPLPEQNDLFMSTLWFSSLLVGVGVLAIVARLLG